MQANTRIQKLEKQVQKENNQTLPAQENKAYKDLPTDWMKYL